MTVRAVRPAALVAAGFALLGAGCSGNPEGTGPGPDQPGLVLSLSGIRTLDPGTEGSYEAWVVANGQPVSAGKFVWTGGTVVLANPGVAASAVEVTLEPPNDADPGPSPQRLLTGALSGGRATLSVEGALTQSTLTLRREPGQFTMFSPSDNAEHGYPSFEESGVWLFNMEPRQTPQNDGWVRLTQLRSGWVYEGWMVRDHGSSSALWLSYGKFLPDQTGTINSRDDTGWGPFSGVLDFLTAGEEEYPGDDWIANPLNLPLPAGVTLPLDLREKDTQGRGRWSHVITVEPASNRGEAVTHERPFLVAPYRDLFGDGAPGTPRTITYREDGVPRGTATLR
jgi:hypothetical protein